MKRFNGLLILALLCVATSPASAGPHLVSTLLSAFYQFSGYGGTGVDGSLTFDATTNGPSFPVYTDDIRTFITVAASASDTTIDVDDATAFTGGDEVLIIQMLGAGTGNYETRTISSTTATSITLSQGLSNNYPAYSAGTEVAQVIRVPHYTAVTINSGGYMSVHPFDGQTGGVMFFRANSAVTVNYNATLNPAITVAGKGYPGGLAATAGDGPGGGSVGAGGMNTSPGSTVRQLMMGSGGGGATGVGGAGGGLLMMSVAGTLTVDGEIRADGETAPGVDGGGGSGGTISIAADTVTRTSTCGPATANGGAGNGTGTAGGNGRIYMMYKNTLDCSNATPNASFPKFKVK